MDRFHAADYDKYLNGTKPEMHDIQSHVEHVPYIAQLNFINQSYAIRQEKMQRVEVPQGRQLDYLSWGCARHSSERKAQAFQVAKRPRAQPVISYDIIR